MQVDLADHAIRKVQRKLACAFEVSLRTAMRNISGSDGDQVARKGSAGSASAPCGSSSQRVAKVTIELEDEDESASGIGSPVATPEASASVPPDVFSLAAAYSSSPGPARAAAHLQRMVDALECAAVVPRHEADAVERVRCAQSALTRLLDEWIDIEAENDACAPSAAHSDSEDDAENGQGSSGRCFFKVATFAPRIRVALKEKKFAIGKLHAAVQSTCTPSAAAVSAAASASITEPAATEASASDDGALQFEVDAWLRSRPALPSLEDFDVLKMISKGAFGSVFLVRARATGDLFAVKVLRRSQTSPKVRASFINERNMMLLLDHPFVARLYYSMASAENYYLVMEFISGGDCFSLLQSVGFLDEALVRVYAAELVVTIAFLHAHGVVHRDLKPDNVLIGADGHIRLTDFGLSRLELCEMALDESPFVRDAASSASGAGAGPLALTARAWKRFSQVGTPDYLAPEILLKSAYGPMVDWWALGCVIFELLVGNTPFDGDSNDKIYDSILNRRIQWPRVPAEMSVAARDLISGFLALSPAERLGASGLAAIQAHAFFDGVDWHAIYASKSKFLPDLVDPTDTRYFDGRNAVFYSPLEVSFTGNRLDHVHLGGGGGGGNTAAGGEEATAPADENELDDRFQCIGKAFWSLHALNVRAAEQSR
jgi:serine/threonine protein kinase